MKTALTILLLALVTCPAGAQEGGPEDEDRTTSHRPIEPVSRDPIDPGLWNTLSETDRRQLERMQRMLAGLEHLDRQHRTEGLPADPARLQAELERFRIDPELRKIALEYAMRQAAGHETGEEPPPGGDRLEDHIPRSVIDFFERQQQSGPPFQPPQPPPGEAGAAPVDPETGETGPGPQPPGTTPPGDGAGAEESKPWDRWLSERIETRYKDLLEDARRNAAEDGAMLPDVDLSGLGDVFTEWRSGYDSGLGGVLAAPTAGGPGGSGSGNAPLLVGSIGLVLAILAAGVYLGRGRARVALARRNTRRLRLPAAIGSREELVAAFDSLAVHLLGDDARPSSHVEAGFALAIRDPTRADEIAGLVEFYGRCRYAPASWTPEAGRMEEARRLVALLAGGAARTPTGSGIPS